MAAPYTTESMQVYDAPVSARRESAGLLPLYANTPSPLRSVYLLGGERVVVGRDPDVAISVEANAVSRRHCEIFPAPTGHGIRDLGSRNGTLVDGVFVSESALPHGAVLRIGDALFKYLADGAGRYAGYRLDGTMEPNCRRIAQQSTHLLGGATMDNIVGALERIAPTMLSIIVRGESGTGKEVAAREIHRLSGRRGQFVALNCAALPGTLLESELFGYRKGAFSGADRDKIGLVKAAHGGTLFLDEIGDMTLEAQAKLLRVLQSREVLPLGATQAEPVDVRVVCATHRDLADLQTKGQFRGDLYARLHEYGFTLPPLRDRKEDIPLLVRALLARHGRPELRPTFAFMMGLLTHGWPYNVRELEACVKRAIALSTSAELLPEHLPDEVRDSLGRFGRRQDSDSAPPASPLVVRVAGTPAPAGVAEPESEGEGSSGKAPTETELRGLLAQHHGNVAAVGRALGKERMQIHRWMKRYGIIVTDYRAELDEGLEDEVQELAPASERQRGGEELAEVPVVDVLDHAATFGADARDALDREGRAQAGDETHAPVQVEERVVAGAVVDGEPHLLGALAHALVHAEERREAFGLLHGIAEENVIGIQSADVVQERLAVVDVEAFEDGGELLAQKLGGHTQWMPRSEPALLEIRSVLAGGPLLLPTSADRT